ncbi:hypothetical protein P7C73_g3697, partial [Tremellales sp. Uapishka_1]
MGQQQTKSQFSPTSTVTSQCSSAPTHESDGHFGRVDNTPGGTLHAKPSLASPPLGPASNPKPRNLVRKLSSKPKVQLRSSTDATAPHSARIKAMKTLGENIESFERLVISAEYRSGITHRSASTKAFPSLTKSNLTAAHLDPTPSRRESTSSIKSSRRAEREWRAKVSALAFSSGASRRTSKIQLASRGPVPPRRTPHTQGMTPQSTGSQTPGESTLVTPPPQALSFISRRSFETLGRHRGDVMETPTRIRNFSGPMSVDERISTLLSPPTDGKSSRRSSAHPASYNSLYSHRRIRGLESSASMYSQSTFQEPEGASECTVAVPFESLSTVKIEDTVGIDPTSVACNDEPRTPTAMPAPSSSLQDNRPTALDTVSFQSVVEAISTPKKSADSTPTPTTPYSPMTSFLLHAPSIEKLAFTIDYLASSPPRPRHPYTYTHASSPPTKRRNSTPRLEILGRWEAEPKFKTLTPGSDNGQRPPKSGLPRSDLENWLRSTTKSD